MAASEYFDSIVTGYCRGPRSEPCKTNYGGHAGHNEYEKQKMPQKPKPPKTPQKPS